MIRKLPAHQRQGNKNDYDYSDNGTGIDLLGKVWVPFLHCNTSSEHIENRILLSLQLEMEGGQLPSGEPVIKARLSPKDQEEFMVLETDKASLCETSVTVYHYTGNRTAEDWELPMLPLF